MHWLRTIERGGRDFTGKGEPSAWKIVQALLKKETFRIFSNSGEGVEGRGIRCFPCAEQVERGLEEIQENAQERFILAGILYHNILEFKGTVIPVIFYR